MRSKQVATGRMLWDEVADVQWKDDVDERNNHDRVRTLLAQGADVDFVFEGRDDCTPVMAACQNPEIVAVLLVANPNLEVRNRMGETALIMAAA